jgi:uncharacterized protein YjbJ (UPF0337 family)
MNESKASGYFDEAKGKLKQTVGETFNNQSLADEGAADQLKGHAKQAWGSIKDTAHDLGRHTAPDSTTPYNGSDPAYSTDPAYNDRAEAHNARKGITNSAEKAKNAIQHGLEHLEHAVKH